MPEFVAQDPDFDRRVRDSFARQSIMATIGAELAAVGPGTCAIRLRHRPDICQQHGFLHAGVTTIIADSAAGYAAYSLMPAGSSVLTVEFKMNLMAPAAGESFLAVGRVQKPGRTLTVVTAEVIAHQRGAEKTVALMQTTMMCLPDAPDRPA